MKQLCTRVLASGTEPSSPSLTATGTGLRNRVAVAEGQAAAYKCRVNTCHSEPEGQASLILLAILIMNEINCEAAGSWL